MKRWSYTLCSIILLTPQILSARDYSSPVNGKTPANPDDSRSDDNHSKPAKPEDPKSSDPKEEQWTWKERVGPGSAVALRIRWSPNKQLNYEGAMERSQRSSASYSEQDTFYLSVLCSDQNTVPLNGTDKVLNMLAFKRSYIDRKRTETYENGKTVNMALPNTEDLINLGPNFDVINGLKCYAFDNQNVMASHTEQVLTLNDSRELRGKIVSETGSSVTFSDGEETNVFTREEVASTRLVSVPHVFFNESPHYMFPLFSERTVSPGDTWKFKIPVIIPVEQSRKIYPTQFNAKMEARLREVRDTKNGKAAVVDYHVSGMFDSTAQEFIGRFPSGFSNQNRLIHKISGDGTLVLDVERGWILEKNENFNITLIANSVVVQGADKPARKEDHKAEIKSSFRIKLLLPGTRLKNGAVIPEY